MKQKEYNIAINWHYITVCIIFAAAILLMVLYMPGFRETDSNILQALRNTFPTLPQFIPLLIQEIGRNCYLWPLIASGSVLVSHKYYLEAFLLVFFSQASHLLTKLIKDIVCRQRPCGEAYPGYSFPSHHALAAMCFFGILIYLSIKHAHGFWRYLLVTMFGILILLIGFSRLILGVHFPADVLEGYLLGLILVNLFIILDKFFNRN